MYSIFDQRRILLIATEQAMFTIDAHNNDVRCFPYKSQPDSEQVEIGPPVVGDAVFCNDNEVSNKARLLYTYNSFLVGILEKINYFNIKFI